MEAYFIYRHGLNTANQPEGNGPYLVAEVDAESEEEACTWARKRVTCYNDQHLTARLKSIVDGEEAEIDRRVRPV